MSTYYFLVCDGHRVSTDVIGGRSFPDRWWADNAESLTAFLGDHAECKPHPRLVSEHALDDEYAHPYEREELETVDTNGEKAG